MSITGTAIDAYLRVIRAPVDLTVGRFVGDATQLTIDRADATVRSVAGTLLNDEGLLEDAQRRRRAADERERALDLRAEAERTEETGEQRAQRQRTSARRQQARRTQAAQSRARKDRLEATEEKAEALDRAEEAIEARDEAERLGQAAARVKQQRKTRNGGVDRAPTQR